MAKSGVSLPGPQESLLESSLLELYIAGLQHRRVKRYQLSQEYRLQVNTAIQVITAIQVLTGISSFEQAVIHWPAVNLITDIGVFCSLICTEKAIQGNSSEKTMLIDWIKCLVNYVNFCLMTNTNFPIYIFWLTQKLFKLKFSWSPFQFFSH